jgi:hypothetical protein
MYRLLFPFLALDVTFVALSALYILRIVNLRIYLNQKQHRRKASAILGGFT